MLVAEKDIKRDLRKWTNSFKNSDKYKILSENTKKIYLSVEKSLFVFINERKDIKSIKDIKTDIIYDFISFREKTSKNKEIKQKTKKLYIFALKMLFDYITHKNSEHYTYQNEFDDIQIGKGKKPETPLYFKEDEVKRILVYLETLVENEKHYSYIWSIAFKLMLHSGLRASEVLSLRLEDIELSDEVIPGTKTRDTYIVTLYDTKSGVTQHTLIPVVHIENELRYFKKTISYDDYICKGENTSLPISRQSLFTKAKTILRKCEIGKRKQGLHIYRHTAAMRLYRKKKDILTVKKLLRHANIQTTMIYANADNSDLAAAMR